MDIFSPAAFVFGSLLGSFLNVCIYRIPRGLSIVRPRSYCPHCRHRIAWHDNIPLLSFIVLRGRCRHCDVRISPGYPLVEFITALISLGLFLQYGVSVDYAVYFALASALIVVAFIDVKHMIVPDIITLPGIGFGLLWGLTDGFPGLLGSLGGIVIGGGGLLLVAETYRLLRKREGLGGGDVKLLAMLGAFFGWKGVLFSLLVGSLTGAVTGVAVIIREKKDMKYALPFGPFLAVGALAYLFWGEALMEFLRIG